MEFEILFIVFVSQHLAQIEWNDGLINVILILTNQVSPIQKDTTLKPGIIKAAAFE